MHKYSYLYKSSSIYVLLARLKQLLLAPSSQMLGRLTLRFYIHISERYANCVVYCRELAHLSIV